MTFSTPNFRIPVFMLAIGLAAPLAGCRVELVQLDPSSGAPPEAIEAESDADGWSVSEAAFPEGGSSEDASGETVAGSDGFEAESVSVDDSEFGEGSAEALATINAIRAEARLQPLAFHGGLSDVAWLHSADLVVSEACGHTGSDGSELEDRMDLSSYEWLAIGENVACGQASAEQAIASWMDSAGHRENMLSPEFTHAGVGVEMDPERGPIWTVVFASGE